MATMTMSRPVISSPLADSTHKHPIAAHRIIPQRTSSFPTSRALRPFPSVSNTLRPTPGVPPVKLIEPPQNYKGTFLLDLTQAEFSRQD
ncbi:hypothetical protein E4T56_gene13268 [Termitomyces sp. T112]|nr:hypothetical protein E4T56_gene13268 [Termitomyces sp. T112]KAH0590396.1 hypothetical protein H2248_000551 [Termitomyces sp. 'cryptogamus']KAH0590407.1 hypothetical protein H2248_000562 [Termitomyces sp. 'cryptogamus']